MSTLSVIDVHGLKSSPRPIAVDVAEVPEVDGGTDDPPRLRIGRRRHPSARVGAPDRRAAVAEKPRRDRQSHRTVPRGGRTTAAFVGCADLAPLSRRVAEVRSLVVDHGARSCGIGRQTRERARKARSRVGLRDVDSVHAYAGLLRPSGLLDRAAHVGSGEDSRPTAEPAHSSANAGSTP